MEIKIINAMGLPFEIPASVIFFIVAIVIILLLAAGLLPQVPGILSSTKFDLVDALTQHA